MKVYFAPNKYDGCYYVRCLLPLQANLWDGAVKFLGDKRASNDEMFLGAIKSDIVVFQRPDMPDKTELIRLLKLRGKKIVFDNDDTYRPDSGFPQLELYANKQMIKDVNSELMKNVAQSDLVTTTTEFLAKEYREFNDNVVVLPNCVDPLDWDKPLRNKTSKVRIGLVGSVAYDDFKIILPYLTELAQRDDVQIVMYSLSLPEATSPRVKALYQDAWDFIHQKGIEWHSHTPIQDYTTKMNDLRLDIMLIPRRETYFNKCKSNVKYLESSMLEIPTVASSFSDGNSPYDNDIQTGINGFLAKDEAEFRKYTDMLIADKNLRRKIGKEAKKYTLKHYNIEKEGYRWKEAYQLIK